MDTGVRFNPIAKPCIFDMHIISNIHTYNLTNPENPPRIFLIDNPMWTNTRDILAKFPNAVIDAVNYTPGTENCKIDYTENVKKYNYKSFDLLRKWVDSGKTRKYNIVYLDTENVINRTVDSLIYLQDMISPEFNRVIIVYSLRGMVGKLPAVNGKKYKEKNISNFFRDYGYKDLQVLDIYTSNFYKRNAGNTSMRMKVLEKQVIPDAEPEVEDIQPRKRRRITENDIIFYT